MNPTDYRGASFDVVRRGYDPRQVDERLRFLGAELAAAEHALGSAQERAAASEHEQARMRAELATRTRDRDPSTNFGERVERILRLAEEEAAEVRTRAAEEAAETVRAARAEADRLVSTATATAQQQQQESERKLQRLAGLAEEVQSRLLGTRGLLDELLAAQDQASEDRSTRDRATPDQPTPDQPTQDQPTADQPTIRVPGRAPGAGPGRMKDHHRPARGEKR